MKEIKILGVKVNIGVTMDEVVSVIEEAIRNGGSQIVCTTNPEFILEAQEDEEFRNIINNSLVSTPDGNGVIFAVSYIDTIKNLHRNFLFPLNAFIRGFFVPFKRVDKSITGVDLMMKLCEVSEQKQYTIFLLGGRPQDRLGRMKSVDYDLATKTAERLLKKYPKLKIIGSTSAFNSYDEDDLTTLSFIQEKMKEHDIKSIDMLFVAYGHPKQEKWLYRNINKIPSKIGIGVGGSFAYISDDVRTPPNVFKSMKMEWFYRLLIQPWRVRRIFKALVIFPVQIYIETIRKNR